MATTDKEVKNDWFKREIRTRFRELKLKFRPFEPGLNEASLIARPFPALRKSTEIGLLDVAA